MNVETLLISAELSTKMGREGLWRVCLLTSFPRTYPHRPSREVNGGGGGGAGEGGPARRHTRQKKRRRAPLFSSLGVGRDHERDGKGGFSDNLTGRGSFRPLQCPRR